MPPTPDEFAASYGLVSSSSSSSASRTSSSSSTFVKHVTGPADRWDQIAWKYYGDATKIKGIIEANPTVPIVSVLLQGTTIYVPIISAPSAVTTNLPWES